MKRFLACLSLVGAANFCSAVTPEESLARMKKDIYYLAGEECKGRGIGSDGINKAAEKVVEVFKEAHLQPGNKDSYYQPFTAVGRAKLGSPNTAALTIKGADAVQLKFNDEFTVLGTSAHGKAGGPLAFLGYGISVNADKLKYDDYAGQDVREKVVVVLRKTPKAEQKDTPFVGDLEAAAALVSKIELAEKNGAAGIVFVNDRTFGKDGDPLMDLRRSGGTAAKIPVLHAKRAVLEKLLAAHGKKLDEIETAIDKEMKPQSLPLTGCKIATEVTINRDPIPCKNVVGVLPGSGPLADETIVLGAHYDHLGTSAQGSLGGPAAEGQVHFGADDNASGTTALLELARRFGAMQNRFGRRIVFIAFSGEERGLLGSIHYAKEPLFPLDKTVFMLNLDMVGRAATVEKDGKKKFRLVASGTGTSDGFDKLIDVVNKKFDFEMLKTPAGSGPSDHQSFYQKNIPVLFIHTGTHKDYHRPSDTPDKIELVGMEKIVGFCEIIAAHLATVPERPNYLATKGRWSDPTDTSSKGMAKMPRLGVMPGNYEEEGKGVLVEDVIKEGAAEAGGVKAGDFIISIAGQPVRNIDDYMKALSAQKPGVEIEITVQRKTEKKTLKVTPKAGG